ncbi:unnamed protein product [Symbiodinium natans]|uniref:C3H1-type domain-containing protein n=1 Tax=Symbiodinium natans TaxID=878477 RepID=A0A812QS59_9DINO|nr:unnamed protein product [Symbiodinium natans]
MVVDPVAVKSPRGGEIGGLHMSASFMTQVPSAESMLDDTSSRDEEDFDQNHPEISNLKLVFSTLERGLPSLRRGWRTPDPSPTRRGLPKCAPYAELLEEKAPAEERGRDAPKDDEGDNTPSPGRGLRFRTPSPEPIMPMPAVPAIFPWPIVAEAEHGPTSMQYKWCVSIGSQGHPYNCAPACKYAAKSKGCKDGVNCDRCHLCRRCAVSYAECVKETEEVPEVPIKGRAAAPRADLRTRTPSPKVGPNFVTDSYLQKVAQAPGQSRGRDSESPEEVEQRVLHYPLSISAGSQGHPFSCSPACKYANRGKGCKDGAQCDHCHLCTWKKPITQNRTRPRKPRQRGDDA